MSASDEGIERRIAALLATPWRPPDQAFVAAVDAEVQIEQAYALRRRRAWTRFYGEALGAIAVSAAAVTLGLAGGTKMLPLIAAAMPLVWVATNRWATAR